SWPSARTRARSKPSSGCWTNALQECRTRVPSALILWTIVWNLVVRKRATARNTYSIGLKTKELSIGTEVAPVPVLDRPTGSSARRRGQEYETRATTTARVGGRHDRETDDGARPGQHGQDGARRRADGAGPGGACRCGRGLDGHAAHLGRDRP